MDRTPDRLTPSRKKRQATVTTLHRPWTSPARPSYDEKLHYLEAVSPSTARVGHQVIDTLLRALDVDPHKPLPAIVPREWPITDARRLRLAKAQLDRDRQADLVAVGPRDSRLRRYFVALQTLERAQ